MRKHSCSSLTESSTSASGDKKDSWIASSLSGATVACCYSVDSLEESEDYYEPAHTNEKHTDDLEPFDLELGLTEGHFSCPEGYFGLSKLEELEMAIESYEETILKTSEKSEKRNQLVKNLVQLRLKYQEIKDGSNNMPEGNVILGHIFEAGAGDKLQQYCEKCCGSIWTVVHNWWQCKNCGFKCHNKCLNLITRVCAYTKVAESPQYILDICPEKGLSDQKYRCAECKRKFIFKDNECIPRLCEYNGLSYCSSCHWNSLAIIPARVIHNWDFTPRKVCRASLQFLRIMTRKPELNIESLNPALFGFVAELNNIKKLRENILLMKQYFLTCHMALEEKLLLHLKDRQHFVESADIYSLQDLIDIASGQLLEYLERIHVTFMEHVTQKCQVCRGKGFICEFCKSDEILFPFYSQIDTCSECNSLFHKECYQRWEGHCPRCARRAQYKESHGNE